MKKAIIVHGWGGNPKEKQLDWLKKQLDSKGFSVEVPEMPNTDEPEINRWVSKLNEVVKSPDEETYFVGHSIGCQTIMRYLEQLPEDIKIGGVVFVAGWFNLHPKPIEEEGGTEIAKPWLETQINFKNILKHNNKFVAIFSDNDPYVPLSDADLFKEKLSAKIIIEKEKGHFTDVKELPTVLQELLRISNG